ncbi:hypothetical protein HMPREF1406_01320 [Helicobacter pylori GAM239Bi]|nr:hypothetical protein HMPREF1406_01320 [Helicobacter pylori GAM239Bi]
MIRDCDFNLTIKDNTLEINQAKNAYLFREKNTEILKEYKTQ